MTPPKVPWSIWASPSGCAPSPPLNCAPLVRKIDAEGFYPEAVMRAFGRAGAYAQHLPGHSAKRRSRRGDRGDGGSGRALSIDRVLHVVPGRARPGTSSRLPTTMLKSRLGRRVATGEALGGTALSNPMKTFFGIEPIKLKGKRVDGGYPGAAARCRSSPISATITISARSSRSRRSRSRFVMAMIPCASEGLRLCANTKFVALDGTRTFGVQMRDVMIPDSLVARRSGGRLRQAHPRRLRAAAIGHGDRAYPRLHRDDAADEKPARPRQQISRCSA